MTIIVKTWAQVISENKARLQFFQEKLEHHVDRGAALQHLRQKYDAILASTITDETLGSAGLAPAEKAKAE